LAASAVDPGFGAFRARGALVRDTVRTGLTVGDHGCYDESAAIAYIRHDGGAFLYAYIRVLSSRRIARGCEERLDLRR